MRTTVLKQSLLIVVTALITNAQILAQDRFVATTGNDAANDCSNSGTPCLTIQHAIDEAAASDEISVAAGTYREYITISKSISLIGNNAGVSGTGSRGAETVIQPGGVSNLTSGVVITVEASSVTIDGFSISGDNDAVTGVSTYDALIGVLLNATGSAFTNLDFQNNIVRDIPRDNTADAGNPIAGAGVASIRSAGLAIQGSASGTSGHTVKNNWFRDIDDEPNDNYADQFGYGIILAENAYADISRNRFTDVGAGLLVTNVPKASPTDSLVVDSLYFHRGKAGMILVQGAINLTADSVTIVDPVAFGVRVVKIDNEDTDFYLTNSSITGTSSSIVDKADMLSNYSGLAAEKYAGTGVQRVRIDSCVISDNRNRGLTFRGDDTNDTNIGSVNYSTLEGNAYDGRFDTGNAFAVIVNRAAEVDLFESSISNESAEQTATTYTAIIGNDTGGASVAAGIMTVRSCSITSTTGTSLVAASGIGLQMDASGNWWGTSSQATIAAAVTNTDFSPWLNSGGDEDLTKAGFQPDLVKLNVGMIATQTGSSEFIQEGISDFAEADTLILHSGTFNENPTVNRNIVFETIPSVVLDQITMNGTGVVLTLNGDLSIDQELTMTDGNINVNDGFALALTSNASDVVESATSLVQGRLSYEFATVLSGVGLDFLGVHLVSGNNDLSDLAIARITGSQGTNGGGGGSESIAVSWDLTSTSTPTNWTINFSWPAAYDNGNSITDLFVWRDGGSGFTQVAGPIVASGDPRVTDDIVINSFSVYTVADGTVTLPVTLTTFNASETGMGQATLNWTTLSEVNTDYFQVERSSDGIAFSEVARIAAAGSS
ncbi:MAG: hypothetical protein AAFO69_06380, partial [Bacteroidota bacterium]